MENELFKITKIIDLIAEPFSIGVIIDQDNETGNSYYSPVFIRKKIDEELIDYPVRDYSKKTKRYSREVEAKIQGIYSSNILNKEIANSFILSIKQQIEKKLQNFKENIKINSRSSTLSVFVFDPPDNQYTAIIELRSISDSDEAMSKLLISAEEANKTDLSCLLSLLRKCEGILTSSNQQITSHSNNSSFPFKWQKEQDLLASVAEMLVVKGFIPQQQKNDFVHLFLAERTNDPNLPIIWRKTKYSFVVFIPRFLKNCGISSKETPWRYFQNGVFFKIQTKQGLANLTGLSSSIQKGKPEKYVDKEDLSPILSLLSPPEVSSTA